MSTRTVQTARFKRAMTIAKEIGLTNDQRHQLAQMIPTTDQYFDGSWKQLDEAQLSDLIWMLDGFIYIRHLASLRPPTVTERV